RTRPRFQPFAIATHRQLVLFDAPRDLARIHGRDVPAPPIPALAAALEAVAIEHAEQYGWRCEPTSAVRRALRLLLVLQDTPGAVIKASEVEALRPAGLPVLR